MVTMRDVAKSADVSLATVSHVINNTRFVSSELTNRVEEVMEALSYRPNRIARSLRTKRSHSISLVVSDITNPFFSAVVRGAEDAAVRNGFSVVVSNTDEDQVKEERCLEVMRETQPDGVIITPTGRRKKSLLGLQEAMIPLVLIDRKVPGVKADVVLSENVDAAFQATRYLIERGHKCIGVILGEKGVTSSDERFKGFKKALRQSNISLNEANVVRGHYRIAGGRVACQELLALEKRPSAIFAVNNRMTIGALEALQAARLRCPRDISVIGFDDFEALTLLDPPLTTVAQQPYQLGYEAVEILMNRIDGDRTDDFREYRLNCNLIVRKSVADAPVDR